MSTRKRSDARRKGLRVAAKVATVGGFALAALGLAEARAASLTGTPAASAASVASKTGENASEHVAAPADDAQPLPMEGLVKVGGCGCSPCWGPPAPPASSRGGAGRAARSRPRSRARSCSEGASSTGAPATRGARLARSERGAR